MVFQFTSHKAPSSEALPRKSEIQSSANVTFKKKKSLSSFTDTQFTLFLFSITLKVLRSWSYVHCSELKCRDVTSFTQQSHSQTSQGRKWNKQGRLQSMPFPDRHRDRTREALTLWITTLCALANRLIPNPCFNTSVKFLSHPNLLFQVATRQQYMKLEGTTRR